ncbi:MAG: pseudouridine synthase, partial [Limisphaerales bacterium]
SREVDHENGCAARTEFKVLKRDADGTTLLEVIPLTGRTNQIRIHLWELGFPICGDPVYLPGKQLGTTQTLAVTDIPLCLHAWKLEFTHPLTKEPMALVAPEPEWNAVLKNK